MSVSRRSIDVLDEEFLEIRAKLLEIAASLDRIARADNASSSQDDERLVCIREAIQILNSQGSDRAEQIQLVFSDNYDAGWER